MLGRYVYSYFSKKGFPIRKITGYRVTRESLSEIEQVLITHGIGHNTCVINCIGSIPQRNADINSYYVANSIFPQLLWQVCKKYGAKMIQPTTDCVFSGSKGTYTENDSHDETGHYGISKSLGEPSGCTVIRTSIIGEELFNKKSFLEFVKNSDGMIQGWENHAWNGITCLQYCKIIDYIIENNLFWEGVRHIYSPITVSKYELACMIRNTYNIQIYIQNKSSAPCDKTLASVYRPIFEIPDISTQIEELKSFQLIE